VGQGPESADGGIGGAGIKPAGGNGKANSDSGGGGGASGRVRVNATAPNVQGQVSPAASTGGFVTGALLVAP
jgi:hypothetical protein